jgi:hypothetical protein
VLILDERLEVRVVVAPDDKVPTVENGWVHLLEGGEQVAALA